MCAFRLCACLSPVDTPLEFLLSFHFGTVSAASRVPHSRGWTTLPMSLCVCACLHVSMEVARAAFRVCLQPEFSPCEPRIRPTGKHWNGNYVHVVWFLSCILAVTPSIPIWMVNATVCCWLFLLLSVHASCLISLNCVAAFKWRAITLSAYFIAVVVILIRCNFVLQTVFPPFPHIQQSYFACVMCVCGWRNKRRKKNKRECDWISQTYKDTTRQ